MALVCDVHRLEYRKRCGFYAKSRRLPLLNSQTEEEVAFGTGGMISTR